ncbi:MAG: tetratricopeptide repeat protein [Myxococcales bacterium]
MEEGEFAEHDRAEYWLGSAWLALREREAATRWFGRVGKDHPESLWVERSWLGLGDAAAQGRRYGIALDWYAKARTAGDASVREMGRVSERSTLTLRARQRWAWVAGAIALAIAALLAASLRRHRPLRLWPLPAEARIVVPVLGVLALLSLRQDRAPRAAILELCAGAALLVTLSGWRLRAASPRGTARALHAAGTLAALGALAYVAVYRGELVGMLLETLRAGPE